MGTVGCTLLATVVKIILLTVSLGLGRVCSGICLFLCVAFFVSKFNANTLCYLPFTLCSSVILSSGGGANVSGATACGTCVAVTFGVTGTLALLIGKVLLDLVGFSTSGPIRPLSIRQDLNIVILIKMDFSILATCSVFGGFSGGEGMDNLFFGGLGGMGGWIFGVWGVYRGCAVGCSFFCVSWVGGGKSLCKLVGGGVWWV